MEDLTEVLLVMGAGGVLLDHILNGLFRLHTGSPSDKFYHYVSIRLGMFNFFPTTETCSTLQDNV